jgi:hypothetical protein
MDVVPEQSLKMVSPNGLSSGLLAVVFDLPVAVQPLVVRGERRKRRGQVRTGESERGEWTMRGIMPRLLQVSRHFPSFPTTE